MNLARRIFLMLPATLVLSRIASAESGAASDAKLSAVLEDIARARASLKTLVGPFTQKRTLGLLSASVTSTGTLTLVRPDHLRWELGPPDDIVYYVTPEGFAYKSRRGQGRLPPTTVELTSAMQDLRVLLGGDLRALLTRYEFSLLSATASGVAFRAIPRSQVAMRFQAIEFSLDADLVRPTRAMLAEGPRDRTEIVFGPLRRDVPVDPSVVRLPG